MLAAFLNNNLPYERTIMNSKMTLTAVLVASLFSAQAMAGVVANEIRSDQGFLTVSKGDFDQALANSKDGKDGHIPGLVKFTYFGSSNNEKNGVLTLDMNGQNYEMTKIRVAEMSGFAKAQREANFNLTNTKLTLTDSIEFSNAAVSLSTEEGLPAVETIQSTNSVKLDKSHLVGNVVNVYQSWNGGNFTNNSLSSKTGIFLTDGSSWQGDLIDRVNEKELSGSSSVKAENVHGEYTVSLKNGSSWVGGVSVAENSTTEVMLDASSSWTVNKDSKVNTIKFDGATREAAKQGVVLAQDVTLTIANGTEESSIANLKSEAGSALAVENAKVTITNASGNTNVVLNEKGQVKIDAAADKVNAKFNTLEGTKFTTADSVKAGVEVSGALVDALGMDTVIAQFNDNKSYEGKGSVLFSGGFIADDRIGYVGADGKFVQTASKTNAKLVSIGESTAVTMMQWRAEADDMAQRMGELRNNDGAVGLWARTYGGKAEADHVSNKYNGIQVGADTQIGAEGVKHFVGGAFSYNKGDADFINGSGDNYMASLTAYSTWIYEGGSYLDVSAKWGKLTNEFDIGPADANLAGKFNTHGIAMSVETGHRFPVGSLAYVEPQLAFTASHISGERYEANQGVTIEQDSIDSYVARVGVQAGLNCPDNVGSLFVRASYLYDFDGETSTTGRSAKNVGTFDQDFGGGWYELGVGMNVNFTKNFHGYADFEYVTGGEIKTPYRWNAGVRYTF